MASVAVVVFTRDLRVDDHPALARAPGRPTTWSRCSSSTTPSSASAFNRPNRTGFLLESLHDLDDALRALGARAGRAARRLGRARSTAVVRACRARASVHVSDDVSGYARASTRSPRRPRSARGRARAGRHRRPARRDHARRRTYRADHYKVFTPYFRRWSEVRRRHVEPAPARVVLPRRASSPGCCPTLGRPGRRRPVARRRRRAEPAPATNGSRRGSTQGLRGYADHHDDLPGDATSRLSPYLHFGCLSPLEVLRVAAHDQGEGADAFVRQLCWRDFYAPDPRRPSRRRVVRLRGPR